MPDLRELVFVAARGQNAYFGELADALSHELGGLGLAASTSLDELPQERDDAVSVLVAPHEFAALAPPGTRLRAGRMRRTIAVCTEQPGTAWHAHGARVASLAGAAFDINRAGVHALRSNGIRSASHLQLGYSEELERSPSGDRDIDLCFLGGATDRRKLHLARYAGELWRHRCHLGFADNSRPSTPGTRGFAAGEEKLDLLARSRVLLNIHRDPNPYFEWARVLDAIHCGVAVVSEQSVDFEPLEPGEHLLFGQVDTLHMLAAELLADEERRAEMAARALEYIRNEVPLRAAAERLAEAGQRLLSRPARGLPRRGVRAGPAAHEPRLREVLGRLRGGGDDSPLLRKEIKRARLEMMDMRREVAALAARLEDGVEPDAVVTETTSRPTPARSPRCP